MDVPGTLARHRAESRPEGIPEDVKHTAARNRSSANRFVPGRSSGARP